MGSKQLTFPKITSLPPETKMKLDAMLFEKTGVTLGAKFLITIIDFPSFKSCYAYLRDYKAYLVDAYSEKKLIPPTLAELTKLKVLEAVDITQKQAMEAVDLIKRAKLNARALEPVKDFTALQEMTVLAFIQRERTLRMMDQEDANLEANIAKPFVSGIRENIESTFTMFTKVAQLQMDLGILHKQDKATNHLHISVQPQQEELLRRFNEQQHLNDITTRALEIILEAPPEQATTQGRKQSS